MDTLCLFQSLSRRRTNDMLAFDILFYGSASMWPYLVIILPRYVNSCTGFSVVLSTFMFASMGVIEFGWNITSVFFMLIFRPNLDDALANSSTILDLLCWVGNQCAVVCKTLLSNKYICVFCLRSEVCNCKEVRILSWLDVDSVPHVHRSLFQHCWQKDR